MRGRHHCLELDFNIKDTTNHVKIYALTHCEANLKGKITVWIACM